MVPYTPKHWVRLLFSFRGTVWPAVLPRLVILGLWTASVAAFDHWVHHIPKLEFPVFTLMGIVVGFLIVLRTNTAYDRFWEGRKLWGGIVNSARNLMREATAYAGNAEELDDLVVAYVVSLKQHVRREKDFSEIKAWVSEEVYKRATESDNPPLIISYYISSWIQQKRLTGSLESNFVRQLEERVRELIDYQGGCERILKTPIPFTYAVHIKQFLTLYLLTLPFVLVSLLDWLAIPMVLVIAFGLGGVEEAGVEVEDPFGQDPNDLPLESICTTIARDALSLTQLPFNPETEVIRSPRKEGGITTS